MQVQVLFFGVLKEITGHNSEDLTLDENATGRQLLKHYEQRFSGLAGMLQSIAIAVNQEYTSLGVQLKDGDEVALLPPVSGGSSDAEGSIHTPRAGTSAGITRKPVNKDAILAQIQRPEDGAVVIFEGVVRNHSRGRQTLFLEYEAYEEMALKQMNALAGQARSQFQVREVSLVHRLGHLDVGETSVVIVVASAHRAAAFDACHWLIDTLKRTVPIWKKEHFEDGAVWADGEPFPEPLLGPPDTHSRSSASK